MKRRQPEEINVASELQECPTGPKGRKFRRGTSNLARDLPQPHHHPTNAEFRIDTLGKPNDALLPFGMQKNSSGFGIDRYAIVILNHQLTLFVSKSSKKTCKLKLQT